MRFSLALLLSIQFLFLLAQPCSKYLVVDGETNEPLIATHIVSESNPQLGTLTDSEGVFVICTNGDYLVSHVGYNTKLISVSLDSQEKGIKKMVLSPKVDMLEDVEVIGLSALQTMYRVIDSLYINHHLFHEGYEVYVREVLYQENHQLDFFNEYLISTWINKKDKLVFFPSEMRAKGFTSKGRKYSRDLRLIKPISVSGSHILFQPRSYYRKRGLRRYQVIYDNQTWNDREIVLKLISKDDAIDVLLHIDSESFAVKKEIRVMRGGGFYSEIEYYQKNGKWYLKKYTSLGHKLDYKKDKEDEYYTLSETRAVFTHLTYEPSNLSEYQNWAALITQPINPKKSDWDNPNWKKYSKDLPDWVDKVVNPD